MWIFIDRVIYRCNSDSVLFSFFIDRILFRVLSPRVLFEFSVIESSSESAVFFINALFSPCRYFLSNRATIFFIKNRCLVFTFIIFSETISWTCLLITSTNLKAKEMNEEIHDKDTKYYIEYICHQFPDLHISSICR